MQEEILLPAQESYRRLIETAHERADSRVSQAQAVVKSVPPFTPTPEIKQLNGVLL